DHVPGRDHRQGRPGPAAGPGPGSVPGAERRRGSSGQVRSEVADLLDGAAILRLADPADYDRGRALVDRAAVQIESVTPARVSATVLDGEPQRVELRATQRGLEWWCSCPPG